MVQHVTDEQIQEVASTARPLSLVRLRWTAERHREGGDAIEREHQRRMVGMRADGTIAVLLPVLDDDVAGTAIMVEPVERAREIMADDPCVIGGMMTCEVLPCLGFPGDTIPG